MVKLNDFTEYQKTVAGENSKIVEAINSYNNRPHIPITLEEARELGRLAGRIGKSQAEAERKLSPRYKALTNSIDQEAEYLYDRKN